MTENTTSYGYDALNRLTSWIVSGVSTTYDYDDAGNLTTVEENGTPTKTFSYNAANQIASTGFGYDENGNMISDGSFNYQYDGENRLKKVTKVSDGSTVAEYTYDYLGRRTSKTVGENTTYFHYDNWNVVAETDSTGAILATYAYDNGSASLTTGQLVSMTRAGQTYFYQYNAHGDVVSLTNSAGQVVNTYEYDPWGKVLTANETVENPYRYAGYRYDSETELYYLQHRYYSPQIMRFLTKDARAGYQNDPQSLNSYAYCFDNPLTNIDKTGIWGKEVHYGMTYRWARDVGFNPDEARIIAYADWQVDITKPYERGRHFNMSRSLSETTQSEYAQKCLTRARKLEDVARISSLIELGRALHSIQDEICHGKWYYSGLHVFGPYEAFGHRFDAWNPDVEPGFGRFKATELTTKFYLSKYLPTTKVPQ